MHIDKIKVNQREFNKNTVKSQSLRIKCLVGPAGFEPTTSTRNGTRPLLRVSSPLQKLFIPNGPQTREYILEPLTVGIAHANCRHGLSSGLLYQAVARLRPPENLLPL